MSKKHPPSTTVLLSRVEALIADNLRLKHKLEETEAQNLDYWNHILFLQVYGYDTSGAAPCPFCGSRRIRLDERVGHRKWSIACVCGATGPERAKELDAIDAWNAALRPDPAAGDTDSEGMQA